MANGKNYYEILGITKNASEEQVRKAFRGLAMEWHPDRNRAEGAEERFKEINEAYQVLIDPKKRQMYDQFGRVDIDPNSGFPGRGFDGFNFQGGVWSSHGARYRRRSGRSARHRPSRSSPAPRRKAHRRAKRSTRVW